MTLLKIAKMEKVTSKNTKQALRNRNAYKLLCCSEEATMFLL